MDWINWSREFRIKARPLNLWTYIEPDKNIPWPIQPIAPNMANYPKRAVRSETRGRGQAETPAPEQVDPRGSPTSIGEMTTSVVGSIRSTYTAKIYCTPCHTIVQNLCTYYTTKIEAIL
jgi:hypothetical protein